MEHSIFSLWRDLAQALTPLTQTQLKNFVTSDGLIFVQTISEYLRRELKVPEYSEMYDDREQLLEETSRLFTEQLGLEDKLGMLKVVILAVWNAAQEVTPPVQVFESLKALSEAEVRDYRLLQCLRLQKTSFKPSFDDVHS